MNEPLPPLPAAVAAALPSAEYKVTFADGSVSALSVHSDETLEGTLAEMLRASRGGPGADISDVEVRSVDLLGTLDPATAP